MQSGTSRFFWRLFYDLPFEVRREARRVYQLFQSNPDHPSLALRNWKGKTGIYSARIGLGYRALAVRNRERLIWYWIGSHSDYDRLV